MVNWHIIRDTLGLRSERLPCPETAVPHSVQKTSKWGLITLPCWILPSYSTFVLVVSAKSPNCIAEAFLSSLCFIELCEAFETNVYNQCSLWGELWEDKVEDNMSLTSPASVRTTTVNCVKMSVNCVKLCETSWVHAWCVVTWKNFAVCELSLCMFSLDFTGMWRWHCLCLSQVKFTTGIFQLREQLSASLVQLKWENRRVWDSERSVDLPWPRLSWWRSLSATGEGEADYK